MKTIKLLTLLFCTLILNSCSNSNDDDDNSPEPTLQGGWTLKKVQGGIGGVNQNFDDELVTWTFNANGTVSVFNTNTDDTRIDFFETGDYTYDFEPNTATPDTCAEALILDNVSFGCHDFSGNGNTLTLSQVESDGYQLTLERIVFITN
jgi:hypothetical protein